VRSEEHASAIEKNSFMTLHMRNHNNSYRRALKTRPANLALLVNLFSVHQVCKRQLAFFTGAYIVHSFALRLAGAVFKVAPQSDRCKAMLQIMKWMKQIVCSYLIVVC
jgi:hypothetical protein